MDASAIIQDAATIENMKVMTDVTREYGVYDGPGPTLEEVLARNVIPPLDPVIPDSARKPGVVTPWSEKKKELSQIQGG